MSKKKDAPSKTPVLRDSTGRWQKGTPPPNPQGRPKDGESWASVIKAVGNMYPQDIVDVVGKDNELGRVIAQLPKNVQLKYLVTARIFAALMFEPTSGLLNALMDRADGPVVQKVAPTTPDGENPYMNFEASELIEIARKVAENAKPASE